MDVFVLMRSFANLPDFQPIQKDKPSVLHQILSRIISEPHSFPLPNSRGKCGAVVSFHRRTRYQNKNVSIRSANGCHFIKTKREGQREVQAKKRQSELHGLSSISIREKGCATAKPNPPCETITPMKAG